jgi:hypothetical protein
MRSTKLIAAVATGAALLLAGCGGLAGNSPAGGGGDTAAPNACTSFSKKRPVTVLIVDVSGSTKALRAPGGQFENDWRMAACYTAMNQGSLWATTADSQTVADSLWMVNGKHFTPTITDNPLLAAAEVRKQAEALAPQARNIVGSTKHSQSDLLGALQVAARLFRSYPDQPRELVFLTDGGINAGGVNLGFDPPRTDAGRSKVIGRLQAAGQVPDLTGGAGAPVRVWMGGLGHGVGGGDPRKTQAVIDLWRSLIPAAHGELASDDSSLRLPDFP